MHIAMIVLGVVYPVVEYFLGKTSKGSVIGVILSVVAKGLKAIGG